jgi:hypothetical protein
VAKTPAQWAWTRLMIEAALQPAAVPAVMPSAGISREEFIAHAASAFDVACARLRVLTTQAERATTPPDPPRDALGERKMP